MASSPTSRSLETLRNAGYLVAVVEHWNPYARIRQDLFGIIDLLAIRPGETLAVQTTSKGNMSARAAKIAESEAIGTIRAAGWKIHIHGWAKGKDGKWAVKVQDVS